MMTASAAANVNAGDRVVPLLPRENDPDRWPQLKAINKQTGERVELTTVEQQRAQEASKRSQEAAEQPQREAAERAELEEHAQWEAKERACKGQMAREESEGREPDDCETLEPNWTKR